MVLMVGIIPKCVKSTLYVSGFFYRSNYDKYSEDPEFKPVSRDNKDIYEEVRDLVVLKNAFTTLLMLY